MLEELAPDGLHTHTSDGVEVTPDLRVLTSDGRTGVVPAAQFGWKDPYSPGGPYFNGKYWVRLDDGPMRQYTGAQLRTI